MGTQVELSPLRPPLTEELVVEATSSSFSRMAQMKQELLQSEDLSESARKKTEREMRRARAAAKLLEANEKKIIKARSEAEARAAQAEAIADQLMKTTEADEKRLDKSYIWNVRKLCKGISDEDLPHWVYYVCEQHGVDAKKRAEYSDEFLVYTAIQLNAGIIQRNWRRYLSSRKTAALEAVIMARVAKIKDHEFSWTKDTIVVELPQEPPAPDTPPPAEYRKPTAASTAKAWKP